MNKKPNPYLAYTTKKKQEKNQLEVSRIDSWSCCSEAQGMLSQFLQSSVGSWSALSETFLFCSVSPIYLPQSQFRSKPRAVLECGVATVTEAGPHFVVQTAAFHRSTSLTDSLLGQIVVRFL